MVLRNGMALLVGMFVVCGGFLSGPMVPASAFTLYDDFPGDHIDESKWIAAISGGSIFEIVRGVTQGKLFEWLRAYGRDQTDVGVQVGRNELKFAKGNFIGLRYNATVAGYALQGCPTPGSDASRILAGFNATVFNDGKSSSSSNKTGDVGAGFLIVRRSDSADPAHILTVEGTVFYCLDSTCTNLTDLGTKTVGFVAVGDVNFFQWTWDIANSRFVFQKNNEDPIPISYTQPVVSKRTFRNLQARIDAANCTHPTTPFGELAVFYEKVFTLNP